MKSVLDENKTTAVCGFRSTLRTSHGCGSRTLEFPTIRPIIAAETFVAGEREVTVSSSSDFALVRPASAAHALNQKCRSWTLFSADVHRRGLAGQVVAHMK